MGRRQLPFEIERKFLTASEAWRPLVIQSQKITDGLVMEGDGRKLRVRLCDGQATLTYKGPRETIRREEIELPLALEEADRLLQHHCDGRLLSKTRHLVPQGDLVWQIDVYDAPLDGITLAEVELPAIDHELPLPDWIGQEVTGDPAFRKINLLQSRT